jgi:predicted PurR-regulated permease PerM
VPLVDQQIKLISSIDIKSYVERLSVPIRNLEKIIINLGLIELDEGFLVNEIQKSLVRFSSEWLNTTAIGQVISNIFNYAGTIFLGALAVLFISFFLLYERNYVKRAIISLIPNKYFEMSLSAFNKTEALLGNYLTGILIQMLAIFLLAFTGLFISNIKYAVTIALFAAIANLIPFLGPVLGASFGIVIGVSSVVGTEIVDINYGWLIAKILIVFGTVQLADNIIFQPLIFSRSVKAHPLVIFLVVLIGGSISVPFGMIAAIPVYTVIRVSYSEFYKGFKEYRIFRV